MTIQATVEDSKSGIFITPGLVVAFAGGTAPSGWLLCQGQAVLRSSYPLLFAAIGTTYNTQIDPTTGGMYGDPGATYFRLPDYRGIQMRGVGTPSGLDPVTLGGWQHQKTAPNGLSTSSDGGHSHDLNNNGLRLECVGGAVGSPYGSLNDGDQSHPYRSCNFSGTYSNSANIVPADVNGNGGHGHGISGDNETRPVSKGVYFLIKV